LGTAAAVGAAAADAAAVIGGIALADDLPRCWGQILLQPAFYPPRSSCLDRHRADGRLITGCIGAGGGFIIAPALMSAGSRAFSRWDRPVPHLRQGIMAASSTQIATFRSRWRGVPDRAVIGATCGGILNRWLYD